MVDYLLRRVCVHTCVRTHTLLYGYYTKYHFMDVLFVDKENNV